MAKRRRKLKKRIVRVLYLIILILVFVFIYSIYSNTVYVLNTEYNDNKAIINYKTKSKNIYCILTTSETIPSLSDKNWVKGKNGKCNISVEKNNNYKLYLKNDKKIVFKKAYNTVLFYELKLDKDEYLISSKDSINISYDYITIGENVSIKYSEYDTESIDITDNIITFKSPIETSLVISFGANKKTIKINATDLIVPVPKSFDFKKKKLGCNVFTDQQNDLLDKILKTRIEEAGYKTRAGVVEAARFLTLELPYRVDYFYENGRIAYRSYKVDGEGRYYHIGLYLSNSRKSNIEYKSKGPAIWGCKMYNSPAKRNMENGLDCSGFVSWAMLNGGFDPGDIGAGITDVYDMTDTGTRKSLTSTLAKSDTIKTGDLLWKSAGGGHIAIIVGIDDKNFYVAEALWNDYPETGVIINTYPRNKIHNQYRYVILMDSYYKEDGNYTKDWK